MKKRIYCFLLFLLCKGLVFAQEKYPSLKTAGKAVNDFVPAGWEILIHKNAELNSDSLSDKLLVLKKAGEDSLSTQEHPVKRIFALLLRQKDNSLKLTVQNVNVVYYYNYDLNFKDALTDIRTGKNVFYVDHYGGFATRWGRSSTFKYSAKEKNWFLTEDEYTTFSSTDPENTEKETVLTSKQFGKISLQNFNIYKKL